MKNEKKSFQTIAVRTAACFIRLNGRDRRKTKNSIAKPLTHIRVYRFRYHRVVSPLSYVKTLIIGRT